MTPDEYTMLAGAMRFEVGACSVTSTELDRIIRSCCDARAVHELRRWQAERFETMVDRCAEVVDRKDDDE